MARASSSDEKSDRIPASDVADPSESPDPNDQPGDGQVAESAKAQAAREPGDLIPVATEESITLEPGAPRAVGYDHEQGEYLSQ